MIGPEAKQRVRERAAGRCEYCRIHQAAESFITFHVEHVVPRQHGGTDDESNLALACHHCNRHKGPNLAGIDPVTGAVTPLYNPRSQPWDDHFMMQGPVIVGRTAVGRTTVSLMRMNEKERLRLRSMRVL